MFLNLRRVFFKTGDEGGAGGGGGGSGEGDDKRKAHSAVVDQVHGLDDRVKRLETPFYERLFKAAEEKKEPPPATGGVKTPVAAAPKAKTVLDELGECMDPFGLFDETPPPVKTPEAPASDEAAA